GIFVGSPCRTHRSRWFRAHALTCTSTSSSSGTGRGRSMSWSTSGPPGWAKAIAFMELLPPEGRRSEPPVVVGVLLRPFARLTLAGRRLVGPRPLHLTGEGATPKQVVEIGEAGQAGRHREHVEEEAAGDGHEEGGDAAADEQREQDAQEQRPLRRGR